MKIAVGIGNPGTRYAGTRHNVGFRVIEKLADSLQAGVARERFEAAVQEASLDGEKLLLVRPLTYVNLSGTAVRRLADWYRCEPGEIIVVSDDVNLPLAGIRIRRSGSSGGHKGIESIIEYLDTVDFPRIRIGIGSPDPMVPRPDYVLSKFSPEEEELIEAACREAAEAVLVWAEQGIDECMNTFNRKEKDG